MRDVSHDVININRKNLLINFPISIVEDKSCDSRMRVSIPNIFFRTLNIFYCVVQRVFLFTFWDLLSVYIFAAVCSLCQPKIIPVAQISELLTKAVC